MQKTVCQKSKPSVLYRLSCLYVFSACFTSVLRVCFYFKCDLLTFVQSFETICDNCGEMYENIVAAFVVCDETVALFLR